MSIDPKSLSAGTLRAMHRPKTLIQPTILCTINCAKCGERFKSDDIFERLCPKCGTSTAPKWPARAPETGCSASEAPKRGMTAEVPEIAKNGVFFVILGQPMGKPRMTIGDKWKKRPCVVRYWAWAAKARESMPENVPKKPLRVIIAAYFEIPKSWSRVKRQKMEGDHHRQKPDADNILKCLDALFSDDACIAHVSLRKLWAAVPRMEIHVE